MCRKNASNCSARREAGDTSGTVKSARLKSVTSDSHRCAEQSFRFFFFLLSKAFARVPRPAHVRTPARGSALEAKCSDQRWSGQNATSRQKRSQMARAESRDEALAGKCCARCLL
uniref:Uncharacterized protein n=1 Tax=Rhipicephalus zambeziensis TaxID=60191 RepID=A0A224YFT3_9ACAR